MATRQAQRSGSGPTQPAAGGSGESQADGTPWTKKRRTPGADVDQTLIRTERTPSGSSKEKRLLRTPFVFSLIRPEVFFVFLFASFRQLSSTFFF